MSTIKVELTEKEKEEVALLRKAQILQLIGAASTLDIDIDRPSRFSRAHLGVHVQQMLRGFYKHDKSALKPEIEKVLDTTPAELLGFGPSKETRIREAVNRYYLALDTHQHAGDAENQAFEDIQNILGMQWTRGEQAAKVISDTICPSCGGNSQPCGRGGRKCNDCGNTFGSD
jgi:hypothetical protein